jgi:BirA family biotin operon repressor/biotin-[acetyl-CoA-carboxylase] ligase
MRVLTDDPALAAAFVPGQRLERWQREGDLAPHDWYLVNALGGAPVWSQDIHPGDAFWSTIVLLSQTGLSQFDAIERLLGTGCLVAGPIASLALAGSRFHGHRGRQWEAVRGNLHVSVAVPTSLDAGHIGAGLSMLPAVASVDAIANASRGAVRPGIKWVNDIVIGERKVGGVLTAAHTTGSHIDDVVWGFGINVRVAPRIVPTPFVPATTCLRMEPGGAHVTLPRLFWALLDAVARRYAELARAGSAALFSTYRQHSTVVGRAVQVWEESACVDPDPAHWGPPAAEGIVSDIVHDLSLRIDGQRSLVSKGRLALRASSDA